MKKLVLFISFVVAMTSAWAQERVADEEARILLASSVAYANFSKFIEAKRGVDTDLARFVSNIENYKITVFSQADLYVVEFAPKSFRGTHLRGGGATYEIDGKTLKILKFTAHR